MDQFLYRPIMIPTWQCMRSRDQSVWEIGFHVSGRKYLLAFSQSCQSEIKDIKVVRHNIYIYIYVTCVYYTSPVWPVWPFKKVGTLQTTLFQETLFAKYFLMKRRFRNSTFLFSHAPFTVPPAACCSLQQNRSPNLTLRGFSSIWGVNVNWLSWMKRIVSFVRNFYQSSRSMKFWYKGWYRWMIWHQEEGWVHFGVFEQTIEIFSIFFAYRTAKCSIISRNLMFNAVWLFQVALKSCWKRVLPWWWNVSPWWISTSGGRDVSLVWAFRYVWNDGARGMYETMKRNLNLYETSISQYFVCV